ncbi:MAG: class F sortase [Chloroflexi bacterium]|nr:class F sortase [Chloroflexota bacterium]
MTSAHRLAAPLGLALLLAACGDSVPKIQLASPAPSAQAAASVAPPAQQAPPAAPTTAAPTPDAVATALAKAQAVAGSGVATGVTVPNSPAPASPSAKPAAPASPSAAAPAATGQVPVVAQGAGNVIPAGSRLQIPSIGVDAAVQSLGVDKNGVMDVPSNGTDVGWYTFSAVPGQPGNAVISGHLDTTTSTRAVFYRLKELKNGDPMSVVENGKATNFEVFWTKAWADDTAPLALILGNAPSPTLTLITCDGTFDRTSKNYSERLVVRAKFPGSV